MWTHLLMTSSNDIRYSLIVPIYNEDDVLSAFFKSIDQLLEKLDGETEVILVNDGSSDASLMMLQAKSFSDRRYKTISLSRNFGHQIAITAGMDAAKGDAVVVMDADLQDPPEVVLKMIARWKDGYDVVYAKREAREGESILKRWTAHVFYRVLQRMTSVDIPTDVGDFRLVDRNVLNIVNSMRERDRFVRGMFSWVGFKQTSVSFVRPQRAAGETKYSLRKMLSFAADGFLGFSEAPLRLALWLGIITSIAAISYGLYVASTWFASEGLVKGWSSTIVVLSLLGGMNLLMIGIVGLYVGRIHAEVKRRPLYVVDPMERDQRSPDAKVDLDHTHVDAEPDQASSQKKSA